MRKRIVFFYLIATTAWAGPRYILLGVREDIGAADRQTIREKIRDAAGDRVGVFVSPAELPRWQVAANTNIVWRVLPIDKEKPNSPLPKLSITKEQFETWKANNLNEPNKLKVLAADDAEAELRAVGLEPVPVVRAIP